MGIVVNHFSFALHFKKVTTKTKPANHDSSLTVFAYAVAGLGHLRVTDALYDGMPSGNRAIILDSLDKSLEDIHRFTSTHLAARSLMDWLQAGPLSLTFAHLYRFSLRSRPQKTYNQVRTILSSAKHNPKKLLFIATHFGLAHQLAAVKQKLEIDFNTQISLVVVVTDDTFHPIWYVKGADLIVVPSLKTKQRFINYSCFIGDHVPIKVLSYPVSPALSLSLNSKQIKDKVNQTIPEQKDHIHVLIPISGAAVGTQYFLRLIDTLKSFSPRYFFHVVSKSAPYTHTFLSRLVKRESVELAVSPVDREVVDLYDRLFRKEVFSLEITKPSEQAFKALLQPVSRGGVILLLSEPVGPQEKDNLDFLVRHLLVPTPSLNHKLWQMAEEGVRLDTRTDPLFSSACTWRGICLPENPFQSARFIHWMLNQRLFYHMLLCKNLPDKSDPHPEELGTDGVKQFWQLIAKTFNSNSASKTPPLH